MDGVLQVIQSLGFPIACCVFLGFFIKKQSDEYREDVKQQSDIYRQDVNNITAQYNDSIKEFRKAIEKNTMILTAIESKLERGAE